MHVITFVNIETISSTHSFKNDVSNLHFGLSIYYNSFTNIILTLYLASFNCHLTKNMSLYIQSSDQILIAKLLKVALQVNHYILIFLTIPAIVFFSYQL